VSGVGLAMERQWRDSGGYDDHEPCVGDWCWGGWVWFSGFFGLNPRAPLLVCVAVYLFPLWRENVGLVRMISGLNPRDWRFGYGQVFGIEELGLWDFNCWNPQFNCWRIWFGRLQSLV
jgi:hypothetical protein